jgi:hypothetical protein
MVKVTNRIYNEIFTSGTTNWLLGNVGEWQTLKIGCEASVDFYATNAETIELNTTNKTFKLTSGKKWSDYGFDIGQTVTYQFHYVSDAWNVILKSTSTILQLYNDVMEVSSMAYDLPLPWGWDTANYSNLPTETHPYDRGNQRIFDVKMWANVEPEGCRIIYGHISNENSENSSLDSFIDGTTTMFVQPNVKSQPVNINSSMNAVGMQSGMSVLTVNVKRLGLKSGSQNVYQYEFELQYLISSFFENISNFTDHQMPDYLLGDGSLTDNFQILFYPKWNNPNTLIQNDMKKTARLGNTGWFDENYNELENNFVIESLQYFDDNGNPVDAIDYFAPTKVKGIVSGVQNINTNTECGFGFIWVPKFEEDYKNKETPFYQNTFMNTGTTTDGFKVGTFYPLTNVGGGLNSASIDTKNVKFTDIGGGKISFEIIFTPNPNFYLFFDARNDDDRKYVLWLSVADQTLVRNFSDRVSLLVDLNSMIKTVPPAGPYPYIQNAFLEHPFDENAIGVDEYDGFVQDDVLCRLPFQLDPITTEFKKMRFAIEIYNPSTGVKKILEKFDVDMTQFFDDANGVPQFNLNQTRGFKLENGNNKNWLKINREPSLDSGGRFGYLAFYAFKIRYEDWINFPGMPNDFFSATELNNGFHNDWIHYLNTIGWQMNFYTEIDAVENNELKRYKNKFKFKFKDYDLNQLISTQHRYYRDSDNTLLNVGTDPISGRPLGVIISNEPTRLEIEYEIMDGGTWDITNVYATATIEIDKGAGIMQMRQLSSVWGSENDNPLIPLPGQTKLKIEVDATLKRLTTKCLIDPDLLDDAIRYRITGRVGCFANGGSFEFGKYESRYEDKYE